MPHGNKKSSVNNKKKKANRPPAAASHNNNNNNNNNNSRYPPQQQTAVPPTRNEYPDWDYRTNQNQKKVGLSTIYDRYKQATERFQNALEQMVPSSIFEHATAQCLVDAVDYLHEQSQQQPLSPPPPSQIDLLQVMDDLKTAISFRRRVAKNFYQGGDEGHSYFVQVLNYCWITLKPIVYQSTIYSSSSSSRNPNNPNHPRNGVDPMVNRFSALSMEEVLDDSDTIDISTTTAEPSPRPVPPANKEFSLQDLTQGDDYFCAHMFLLSMNEMMQFVSVFYSTMKRAWRTHGQRDVPSETFIEDIMEASVYVNFVIQQIMMMEEELNAKYPYLNTVYRMMTFLVHPASIKDFTDTVLPLVSDQEAFLASRDAIAFMGDIIETGFRNPSDDKSNTEPIVKAFCTKWKLNAAAIGGDFEQWKVLGRFEAPLMVEMTLNQQIFGEMMALGLQPHSWLAPFKYIGGRDRCMMNTIRLLQGLSNVVKKDQPLILKRGTFGRQWDEGRKKATKICGDMDELLMGDLLPTLLLMCSNGMLSTKLPRESELLTFFTVLKSFTMSPEKSTPWSLAFSVHALLTSFFEMQGQNDIEKLGKVAKSCFDLYIHQLDSLIEQQNDSVQGKHWRTNLDRLSYLRWLVHPVHNQGPLVEERAIWNPLCSGLFMEYVCFFGNLDSGIAMVDSFAQLRMVLHLYNAFLQIGALDAGNIPFLDWLHHTFKDCKGVWEGPIPKKGEFVKRFWISWGASIKNAQQSANATHTRLRGSTKFTSVQPPRVEYRDMTPINPEDIATCFRHVCLHDFAGIEDKYHTDLQRQRAEGSVVYELAVRANATMDTMENEQRILASNFIMIGHILNSFIVELFNVLEWTLSIEQMVAETPNSIKAGRRVNGSSVHPNSWEASDTNFRRDAMVTLLVERLLGPLDIVPTPDALVNFNPDRSLPRTAACLFAYFNKFDPGSSEVLFFSPTFYAE